MGVSHVLFQVNCACVSSVVATTTKDSQNCPIVIVTHPIVTLLLQQHTGVLLPRPQPLPHHKIHGCSRHSREQTTGQPDYQPESGIHASVCVCVCSVVHMYVCVISVHMYVCVCSVHTYVCVFSVHMYVCVCSVHMYMCVCGVHMYVRVCLYSVHMYMCVCSVHMYMCVFSVHTYVCVCSLQVYSVFLALLFVVCSHVHINIIIVCSNTTECVYLQKWY